MDSLFFLLSNGSIIFILSNGFKNFLYYPMDPLFLYDPIDSFFLILSNESILFILFMDPLFYTISMDSLFLILSNESILFILNGETKKKFNWQNNSLNDYDSFRHYKQNWVAIGGVLKVWNTNVSQKFCNICFSNTRLCSAYGGIMLRWFPTNSVKAVWPSMLTCTLNSWSRRSSLRSKNIRHWFTES